MSFSVTDTRRAAHARAPAANSENTAIRNERNARRGAWMKAQQQSTGAPGWLGGRAAAPVVAEVSFNDRCVALLTLVDEAANRAWALHRQALVARRRAASGTASAPSSGTSSPGELMLTPTADDAALQFRHDSHDFSTELPLDLVRFEFSIRWRAIRDDVIERLRQYVTLAQRLHGGGGGAEQLHPAAVDALRGQLAMCAPEQIAAGLSVMTLFNKEEAAAEAALAAEDDELTCLADAMNGDVIRARQEKLHARHVAAIHMSPYGRADTAVLVSA
jgi:hypothetical protein